MKSDHRADFQQLTVTKRRVSFEQQKRSCDLDQGDPTEPAHIKEEQEELWTSQEGEQLQGPKEADISTFIFIPVSVKSEEHDGEEPQSPQLHNDTENLKTEVDLEDCEGSEPDRKSNPDSYLQPETRGETSHSESETDDSSEWEETNGSESTLNPLPNKRLPSSDEEYKTGRKSVISSDQMDQLQKRNRIQSQKKPFGCLVCGTRFCNKKSLSIHMILHTKGKGFSCPVCKKKCSLRAHLMEHMRIHTGEKPFSCSVCDKIFTRKSNLYQHQQVHTGEKPFSCLDCEATFLHKTNLVAHRRIHSGEKPFCCSVCGKSFTQKSTLHRHLKVHTGEKPFSCSVCGKRFTEHRSLTHHSVVHTGEKPFSCKVCDESFARLYHLKKHKCAVEGGANK
ncbi:gastrula zinc finger protein XlCGF57.1-like isoform X2 [Xyrichtys novacula]|uniref:Gastrula zinc finger protein XlCGF57.1-like isoform X2 n=1 Tax=Xyrichtys novacula TaxID=13765 RepID=A0AAV1HC43_XYRNO|nr:gastrula zinc finger protein XlCGF57.1-like isoform X2 [Xyrichtys novacula]